jgi:hypothetical protein
MPEINMIFQCSLEIPALSISEKSVCLVSIDVGMAFPRPWFDARAHYILVNSA